MTAAIGDVLVLRGLCRDSKRPGSRQIPPAIGKVIRVLSSDVLLVRMRMGGFSRSQGRWCPRPRRVELAQIVRLATPREQELGMPMSEPTGVRAVAS